MKRTITIVLCIVVMAAFLMTGCAGGQAEAAEKPVTDDATEDAAIDTTESGKGVGATDGKDAYTIGLSLEGLDHSYMITLRDQVEAAAAEYADADVRVITADGQNSTSEQVKGIQDMLTQQVDLLMVQAAEGEGLKPALQEAEKQGIPYMFVGKPVFGTNAITMVNNDNLEIGKNAGEWALEYLKEKNGSEKGNIVIVAGIPGDQSAEDRVNGLIEIIEPYAEIKVIANVPANYRRPEAFKVTQDILQSNPEGSIDLLYAANGESSIGAAQAISGAGRKGEFPVLSVDGDKASIEAIKDEDITVAWTYEPCGTVGFEYAMAILSGEEVDEAIIIPSRQIDASNADEAIPAF